MKTTEVNENIIGKRCKSIFTGLMVTGVIEEINMTKYTAEVKVRFDEPHQWGNEQYQCDWAHARLHDEFGSLRHLEIIDDRYKTIRVAFSQTIREINKMFTGDYSNWQTVNLKEWIDNYESSRSDRTAMKREVISIENEIVHIPQSGDVWMTQHEITDLFGCFVSKVNSHIRSILKSGVLRESDVCRTCHYQSGSFVEVYGLEMIIALSFRIQSRNAELFRKWLAKRLTKAEIPEMLMLSIQNPVLN